MVALLDKMDNPQNKLRFIHIAGTNGKGSTAQLCTNILRQSGITVGTYISPFVVDFRERFQVDGAMISPDDFALLVEYTLPFVDELAKVGLQITEFEIITAIAFEYFFRSGCKVVCLEVGLGGKYDATNVINTPDVAIITSISLDHVDILGSTIAEIAGEKAGIIKENTDVITYPLQHEDALPVFLKQCAKTGSTLITPNANSVTIVKNDTTGSEFFYNGLYYSIKLVGAHQIFNAIAVIEAMHILIKKGFDIDEEQIHVGLKETTFAARFECLRTKPIVILDGAHNKQAATSLAQSMLQLPANKIVAIMGMMADKDYESAVRDVGRLCHALITIPVDNSRAIDYNTLAKVAKNYCPRVFAIADYEEAYNFALSLVDENDAIVICGSFYMASDMRRLFN